MCLLPSWNILWWHLLHKYHLAYFLSSYHYIIGCPSSCTLCSSAGTCLSCANNHYFDSSSSSCTACPTGTHSEGGKVTSCTSDGNTTALFESLKVTIDCESTCGSCSSPTECTSCIANYFYDSASSSCTACDSGTYLESGTESSCNRTILCFPHCPNHDYSMHGSLRNLYFFWYVYNLSRKLLL